MVALVAGFRGFLYLLLVGKLSQRFPGMTVVGYARLLLGRWVGKLLGVVLGLLFALNAAVDLRAMLKSAIGIYYFMTPAWVVASMMAVVALSFVWFGIVTTGRLGPLLLVALVVTFISSFPWMIRWMRPGYLLPLFDWTAVDLSSHSFWTALGSMRAALYLAALMPYVRDPKRAVRVYGLAFWVGWLAVFLAVIAPIMLFSVNGARVLDLPFPTAIAVIRLANFPIERMEMLLRLGYSLSILSAVAQSYFVGGLLLSEAFGTTRTRPFMLTVVVVSLLPNIVRIDEVPGQILIAMVVMTTVVVSLIVYVVLWLAYWFRGGAARAAPAPGEAG